MAVKVPFSPPDISEDDIRAVTDVLRSGWITTGPVTKEFEKALALYCGSESAVCLNSATAGLEQVLRLLEIGPGDEVITTPMTFAASANVILHTGAKPVLADLSPGTFHISPEEISKKITARTKAVIPVDYGGFPCDYEAIHTVLMAHSRKYKPRRGTLQEVFVRPAVIADAAHSLGASVAGRRVGNLTDFTVFSFHAVKNLTTAEGGAVLFNGLPGADAGEIYRRLMLLALHGQSKDALAKMKAGGWKYEIVLPGYKNNMTDMAAALGLSQLKRYPEMLDKRRRIISRYDEWAGSDTRYIKPPFERDGFVPSFHLYPLRLAEKNEQRRDELIARAAEAGIALNVHFIPLMRHPVYRNLGYRESDYPQTMDSFLREISLPVFSSMTDEQQDAVIGFFTKM